MAPTDNGDRPMTLLMRLALRQQRRKAHRRTRRLIAVMASALTLFLGAGIAYAYWTVSGSGTGSARAATVTNLTISQVTPVPALTHQLFPASTGDVVLTIGNPNAFPVTITAITTPATNATGFTDSGLNAPILGCGTSNSLVTWAGIAGSHTLATPLTVAPSNGSNPGTLTVTLTNAAAMDLAAPAACAGAYFQMPSLTAITATGYAATPTADPATDSYS